MNSGYQTNKTVRKSICRTVDMYFHPIRRSILKTISALLVALLTGIFNPVLAADPPTFTISLANAPLVDFFTAVEKQSKYTFIYTKDQIINAKPVTLSVKNAGLQEVLTIAFKNQNLTYTISGTYISIKEKQNISEKNESEKLTPSIIDVKGKIVDSNNRPLVGASVLIKGTRKGTSTDLNGLFNLQAPANSVLVISFVGKKSVEITSNDKSLSVVRLIDNIQSEEIIITGYYSSSKQTFTGAANTIQGDELRSVTNQNVLSALSVLDPSIHLIENNLVGSDPNNLPELQLRGPASIKSTLTEEYTGNPNLPLFILDGFQVSVEKIYDLDPLRVSNITILKDASALAIYGSRGANGVVVITTNQPVTGQLKVTSTTSVDFESANLSDYHLLNATDKLEYERLAGIYTPNDNINTGQRFSYYYNERLKLVQQGINTDWIKKPVKDLGIGVRQNVLLEGGDRSFRYSIDMSYNPTTGVMKGSGRTREGIGITLRYNLKNIRFSNQLNYDVVNTRNSPYGSFSTYAYLNPYYYPYDANGNPDQILYILRSPQYPAVTITNPLYNATINTIDKSGYKNFINNFSLEWDINNSFKLTSRLALNQRTGTTDKFKPADHTDFINDPIKGSYDKGSSQSFQAEANIGLRFNKQIGKSLFVGNGNYNIQQIKSDSYDVIAYGFPNGQLSNIGNAIQYLEGARPRSSESTTRLVGALANFNYSYDQRFLADFSTRFDGSSQFGSNNKWASFWSAGLGWNLHNEKLFFKNDNITLLKIRGSIGYTGSQNFYPYQALLTYQYYSANTYNNTLGALAQAYGNDNLKWQKTFKKNIGLDFGFFNNRLTGYVNIYKDISKDVLVDVTLPPSLGFATYKENLGEVQNTGYEISARMMLFQNKKSNFFWSVFGSALHNDNKLNKISNALQAYNESVDKEPTNKPSVRFIEGQSINTLWVVKSLGIDPATGKEIFYDHKGEHTNVWNSANYIPFHSTDATLEGTLGTSMGYKGFQLNIFFMYQTGGYIYNQTLVDRVENVDPNRNVDNRVFYNRWKSPGDVVSFKAITDLSTTYPTSRFIQKNNWLRLNTINLMYTLPSTGFLKKIGAERAKINAYTNNLFLLSSVKQERGISYPYAKHYAITLQLTF